MRCCHEEDLYRHTSGCLPDTREIMVQLHAQFRGEAIKWVDPVNFHVTAGFWDIR